MRHTILELLPGDELEMRDLTTGGIVTFKACRKFAVEVEGEVKTSLILPECLAPQDQPSA